MTIGIGCDIVDHETTKKLDWKSDKKTLIRIFSTEEIRLCKNKISIKYLSGRFAAKEAILKSIGTGMHDGISLNEIEILQLETGQPFVKLFGNTKALFEKLGVRQIKVSISHSLKYSIAFAIAEN